MTFDNRTYCHITNGIIEGIFCGEMPADDDFEQIPDGVMPCHGDIRSHWDKNWNWIKTPEVVYEPKVERPKYMIFEGTTLRSATPKEAYEMGDISKEEFNSLIKAQRRQKFILFTDPLVYQLFLGEKGNHITKKKIRQLKDQIRSEHPYV